MKPYRLLIVASLVLIVALSALACTPDDWEVVTNSLSASPSQEVVIGEVVEKVYNCGAGGDVITLTPQRSLASAESVQWELGAEIEASMGAGAELLAKFDGELGAELQGAYGKNYEVSQEVGTGWQLPARPGEWISYTIRWSEIWEPGTILFTNGRQQRPVGYRYRKAIKTEIVKKELLDCGDGVTATTPSAEPAPTATPVAAAPAAQPTATPVPVAPAPAAPFQLTIRGYGFPPESMTNPAQRRQAALLAAQMDAKRNLAVWLAGEDIEAVTIVENNQVASDEIRREVSAWLVGVRILSEEYDEASGQATVEIAPALGGY